MWSECDTISHSNKYEYAFCLYNPCASVGVHLVPVLYTRRVAFFSKCFVFFTAITTGRPGRYALPSCPVARCGADWD